jgi:hypothetical protein
MKRFNWHTVCALLGMGAVLAPDLTSLAAWLASLHVGWLAHVARALGGLALLLSRWDRIRGKVQPLIDKLDELHTTVERKRDAGIGSFGGMLVMAFVAAFVITLGMLVAEGSYFHVLGSCIRVVR